MSMYEPLPQNIDLPRLEHDVLQYWRERDVFAQSVAQREGATPWVVYEGPPTANGMPGIHHVEARSFKDAFPRFKTMQGYSVPRRAGWDCHGLPVELAVEKQLGLSSKQEIEEYGIAEFNAKCRESVLQYVSAWRQMTERMGYWVDFDDAYHTMDARYIESLWWAMKNIYERGLLVEDFRVTPYCPRCQTALSSHELGQPGVYSEITSPAAYVRLPLTSGPWAEEADLLIWTTTPWTLVSNLAVAVAPGVEYVRVTHPDHARDVVVARELIEAALGEGWSVVDSISGAQMEGWGYQRPLTLSALEKSPRTNTVVTGEFVTTEDGTGLVHMAPFGADDITTLRRYEIPVVIPVQEDGRFDAALDLVGGVEFSEADPILLRNMQERGILFRHEAYRHSYPHCWRCHHKLLYYPMPSWYIRTSEIKQQLLEQNENTNWHPENVKHGRFGDWLNNNVDWALSRSRYWGTPLPLWRCSENHITCVGSLTELSELSGANHSQLDPHRPFIDEITFPCPECPAQAHRVEDVADVWFDSGAMPFAQWGAPYENDAEFQRAYPAQFICEAIDQTRGWFYTLMTLGTLLFDKSSYENVLCVGLLLDAEGRKMSKHLGNVLEPISLMDQHGADAVRWFMLGSGSAWADRRVSHEAIDENVRRVLLTYWHTAAFQTLYARAGSWSPQSGAPAASERHVMDRWALAQLAAVTRDVTDAMEAFDTQSATRSLATFIDELSNWYVRRSRRRFWDADPSALATLHECLEVFTRLSAPLTPFITERVWRALVASTDDAAPASVHLSSWPHSKELSSAPDEQLNADMQLTRRIIELGRTARAEAKVKTRQPLAAGLVSAAGWDEISAELRHEISAELNVVTLSDMGASDELVEYGVKPQFRTLGRLFGSRTQQVAAAIRAADPATVVAELDTSGELVLDVEGEKVVVGSDAVEITQTPRSGWHVVSSDGVSLALDLELTPALKRAGTARDLVRAMQQARKALGLEITDRVRVWWETDDHDAAIAITEHTEMIAAEVLAVEFTCGAGPDGVAETHDESTGVRFWIQPSLLQREFCG